MKAKMTVYDKEIFRRQSCLGDFFSATKYEFLGQGTNTWLPYVRDWKKIVDNLLEENDTLSGNYFWFDDIGSLNEKLHFSKWNYIFNWSVKTKDGLIQRKNTYIYVLENFFYKFHSFQIVLISK